MDPQNEYKEIAKRWLDKKERKEFRIDDFCFDKQRKFVSDPAPFATALCSVRAGKTIGCASDLVSTALGREGIVCLYLTLNRLSAKRIIWPDLCKINRDYNLGGKINESELSITFPNSSRIYVSGAGDQSEIEKYRGLALALVYVDEAQAFKEYLRYFVDEVLAKRLFDYAGRLRLIGTPGAVPVGYFYECCNNPQWSHHHWTMFDNPWLPRKSGLTHEQILQRELDRKGVTREDPSIQRECFGRWAFDPNALVFRYNDSLNHYEGLPNNGNGFTYCLGVDLGFDDSDAICVLGWNEKYPQLFLIEESVTAKQGITELAGQIEVFNRKYNPTKIVMDTGGLGKKIAEEITRRFSIPITPAEKQRKFEFIELLNDAMRTKKFMAKKDSRFAHDSKLVEWDKDVTNPEKPKIKDAYHSDICDAVLYAFRESSHYLFEPEKPQVKPYSPDWFKSEEDEMWNQAWERQRAVEDTDDSFYD